MREKENARTQARTTPHQHSGHKMSAPDGDSHSRIFPRGEEPRRTGKATRIRDAIQSSALLAAVAADSGGVDSRLSRAANSMASAPSPMTRLIDRTFNLEWSPGRRAVQPPTTDSGGDVIKPAPIEIPRRTRHGRANAETTEKITAAITERVALRERDAQALENARDFHSLFSQQPKAAQGTAHVLPEWKRALLQQQQQPAHAVAWDSSGGGAGTTATTSVVALPTFVGGRAVLPRRAAPAVAENFFAGVPPRSHSSMGGQFVSTGDARRDSGSATTTIMMNTTTPALLPAVASTSTLGFPCVGICDLMRARHAGKQQFVGARAATCVVVGDANSSFTNAAITSINNNNNNNNNAATPWHQKPGDGSRGVRVRPGGSCGDFFGGPRRDQVADAFAGNPCPVKGDGAFLTTSSSIGNADNAFALRRAVEKWGSRPGVNTPSSYGNNLPPVGAAPAWMMRSSTPVPMSQPLR